jgi:starvation-inducible DNA-binding protein
LTRTHATLPATSLADHRREAVIAGLNRHLASMTDLAAAAKQAHWNVRGLNFHGLHETFDRVAADAREYADEIAERAVTLGGIADGTLQAAAEQTVLAPFPRSVTNWARLTGELQDRVVAVADGLRESAAGLDDEPATQDMYIEIIRGLEKWAWMLRAHVEE